MSYTETLSWDDGDTIQEFPFDGVYAGGAPQRKEDVRTVKRQPKRRGLWYTCFAQPRVAEPVEPYPTRLASSRLRLTARQLEYRRTGSPDAKQLSISDIRDMQFKWIQAGGVRVSKVTISVESGKEAVVIRGLKNPEDLVEAIRKRQAAAVEHANKILDENAAGRPSASGITARTGCSDVPAASGKRMTPRALFADATGSPASAATVGCGGMTLLSAFARSPAQDFAGADSVAQEIQLASPRLEDSSFTSSEASDALDTVSSKDAGAQPPAIATLPVYGAARDVVGAAPAPRQPSDSFTLAVNVSLSDMVQPPSQTLSAPPPSPPAVFDGLQTSRKKPAEGGLALQPLSRSSTESSACTVTVVASPHLRTEDVTPEGAYIQGSRNVSPIYVASRGPPPVPEDSVNYAENATPYSTQSGKSVTQRDHLTMEAAPLPAFNTGSIADSGKNPLSPSASAAVSASAVVLHERLPNHPKVRALMEDVSISLRTGADLTTSSTDQALMPSRPAAGSENSSSSMRTPRLVPTLPKQQQRQFDVSHRLAHSSQGPPSQSEIANSSLPNAASNETNVHSEGGCGSLKPAGAIGHVNGSGRSSQWTADEACNGVALAASSLTSGTNASNKQGPMPPDSLGIAAVRATVSALLTSASLTGSVSSAGAAASVAGAPLSLLGLTAAAAWALVTATTVTHMRTGRSRHPSDQGANYYNASLTQGELQVGSSTLHKREATMKTATVTVDRVCAPPLQMTAVVAPPYAGDNGDDKEKPLSHDITHSTAGSVAMSSWCGSSGTGGTVVLGETSAPASGGVTGASGISGGSGDSSEDAATSGAWGSQPALVDLEPQHGVQPGRSAAPWSGITEQRQPHLGMKEHVFPVMLSSGSPRSMPQPVWSREEGTPVAHVLEPSGCHRANEDEQQQQADEEVAYDAHALRPPVLRMSAPAAATTAPAVASSLAHACPQASRWQRALHLTESPVRVLYSVHASVTDGPVEEPQVEPGKRGSTPAAALSVFPMCDSAVQTDSTLAECAVQTEVDTGGHRGSKCSSRRSSLDSQMLVGNAVEQVLKLSLVAKAVRGSCPASAVGAEGSTESITAMQPGAQDSFLSPLEGAHPQLGGCEVAAALTDGTRVRSSERFSVAEESSIETCSSSSPSPGSPGAQARMNAAMLNAPGCSRHSCSLAGEAVSQLHHNSLSKEENVSLECRGASNSNADASAIAMAPCAAFISTELHYHFAAPAKPVKARATGRPDAALMTEEEDALQHHTRQLGVVNLIDDGDGRAVPLSRSGSGSQILSSSTSGTGSISLSASVDSGAYARMSSVGSSINGMDPEFETHIRSGMGTAPVYSRNSTCREVVQACNLGASMVGKGTDPEEADGGRDDDIQQRLLAPEITLSAEPPMLWPNAVSPFVTQEGANSANIRSAQEGHLREANVIDTGATDSTPLLSAGSDTADVMMWLLGPAGGRSSDSTATAAGEATASAPDSPRIPLPPPLARAMTTTRGGVCGSRRPTAYEGGIAKEKMCGFSQGTSNGSHRVPAGSLTWLGYGPRVSACPSVGYNGAGQTSPFLNANQLAPPSAVGAFNSAMARTAGAQWREVLAGSIGSTGNSHNDSTPRSRSRNSAGCGSSCRPTTSALYGAASILSPHDMDVDGGLRSGGRDNAANFSLQIPNSVPHSGASSTSQASPVSPDLSDISSAAYAGGMYTYDSSPGRRGRDVAHMNPTARKSGSTSTEEDDLFHNPLYGVPAKSSPGTNQAVQPQQHGEGGGCIGLPLRMYTVGGSVYGGIDGYGYGTSTCTSSPAPASISQRSVGTASVGRRRTREESATSSCRHDGGDLVYDAQGEHSACSKEAWRSCVAAAAIRCLTRSGHVYSPRQMFASWGGDEPEFLGSDGGVAHHQPSKRARRAILQPHTPPSATRQTQEKQQQVDMQVLHRVLASPLMVLNPAYAQSVSGSPAFTSPQPTTGGGFSSARTEASQKGVHAGAHAGSRAALQRLQMLVIAALRRQQQQREQKQRLERQQPETAIALGVFKSSSLVSNIVPTQFAGGSSVATSTPLVSGGGARVAHLEIVRAGEQGMRTAFPQSMVIANATPAPKRQQPGTPIMLGVFKSLPIIPKINTHPAGGSSAVISTSIVSEGNISSACMEASQLGIHGIPQAGAVASSIVLSKATPAVYRCGGAGSELALECYEAADQHKPQHVTPRHRDLAKLEGSEWSSVQGSPPNQQAAHAVELLRRANDAVDFAREAVQRGDAAWLSRVMATLQAVQSALDALREIET